MDFGLVEKEWEDKPCYIIGGGTSLKPYVNSLMGLNDKGYVIAVNDSYKHCDPDLIFTLDHTWLEKNHETIPSMPAVVYAAVAEDHERPDLGCVVYLKRRNRNGIALLSTDPSAITNGLNSGFGALNLAWLKGCKEIFLLGFDFKPGHGGNSHYHDGYKWYNPVATGNMFPKWAQLFHECAGQIKDAGVKVINCSDNSLLTAFPYKPYREIFERFD